MATTWQFVDSIASSPTVRLDLNNGSPFWVGDGWDLSPAAVRRSLASSMLTDGDAVTAWSYTNRVLSIPLQLNAAGVDAAALALHTLGVELSRDSNILRVQLGSMPYFFRTFAAPDYTFTALKMMAEVGKATLKIPAEPFAYGLKETLTTAVVNNDPAAGSNGMFFEVTGIKGDVETPLFLSIPSAGMLPGGSSTTGRTSCIAVRRRGTPSAAPFVVQAETASPLGTDTTLPGNDAVMSGAGSNYARCSFATVATLLERLSFTAIPVAASVDARGTYRVFIRVRKSVAGDTMAVQLRHDGNGLTVLNSLVTLPSTTNLVYIDLGLVTLPLGGGPITDGYSSVPLPVKGLNVYVRAQRTSGSGNVDFDVLLFVPADDRLALVTWGLNSGPDTFVLDSATPAAYALGGSDVRNEPPMSIVGDAPMISPGVTNRIVFIRNVNTNDTASDDKTGTHSITPYYWPRYLYIRPVAG